MMRIFLLLFIIICSSCISLAQQKTYCNPINVDYGYTPIPNFAEWGKHRATADPVIVNYKGDFYLFSTNQWGYWWSSNMLDWKFVSKKFLRSWNNSYDELCAPAVGIVGDTMLVFGSTYTSKFTLWMSTNPKENNWKPLIDSFEIGGWDPAFFTDDDGKFYMYNGSSNVYPLYGIELNRKTFQPIGTRKEIFNLKDWRYGWQRFGEHSDNTFLDPFMEGAWVTKYKQKYYLQYGAPGTEFSGYADGVAVGNSPLGYFEEQSDPLSMKQGGFARGAGHGATFTDNFNNYWHTSTIMLSVKNNFERRIGIWSAGFDADDVMWCSTAFGDYPHYLPSNKKNEYGNGLANWFLLNYKKPTKVSSTLGSFTAHNANDENQKTYWSATSANKGEWIQSDLGNVSTINAIQINYADQDATFLGKQTDIFHQYKIWYSLDEKKWSLLIDKSNNKTDVPHEYVELSNPIKARYLKLENIHMPTGKFAISGFRIFGNANGIKPAAVNTFMVLRTQKDKRSAWIKWNPSADAYAYNIYYGTAPNKLYNCIMVHDVNEYWLKTMDSQKTYFFTIEAINENGVSEKYKIVEAK
jgi:xylan 1,4-beta-xylosidase